MKESQHHSQGLFCRKICLEFWVFRNFQRQNVPYYIILLEMRYLVTTENSALDDHLVSPRILVTSSMLETLRNNLKHFSERFLLLQILTLKLALATSWILEILWNSCNLFQKKWSWKHAFSLTLAKHVPFAADFFLASSQPTGRPPTEFHAWKII